MTLPSAQLREIAVHAARTAGPALADAFRRPMEIDTKTTAHDLVTVYDRDTEELLVRLLAESTPQARFLGEESGARTARSSSTGAPAATSTPVTPTDGRTPAVRTSDTLPPHPAALEWIIDPIDGTSNFAHGFGLFSISIAAAVDGEVVAGVVHDPVHQRTFSADAHGAYLDHGAHANSATPLTPEASDAQNTRPEATNLLTSFPSAEQIRAHPEWTAARFSELVLAHTTVRRVVSGALELCYAAAGWADVVLGVDTKPWDIAAGHFILLQSGGRFLTWDPHGQAHTGPAHLAPHYLGLRAGLTDAPTARAVAHGWAEISSDSDVSGAGGSAMASRHRHA